MKTNIMSIILMTTLAILIASSWCIAGEVIVDFRIVANSRDYGYVVRIQNRSEQDVSIGKMGNYYYGERFGRVGWYNANEITGPEYVLKLPPDGRHQGGGVVSTHYLCLVRRPGLFTAWQWQGRIYSSAPDVSMPLPATVLVGYVEENGDLDAPVVPEGMGIVSNQLAFVFHANMKNHFRLDNAPPHELAFLLLNGTAEPLDAPPPLSEGSILHLAAPGIGYSTKVVLNGSGFEAKTIPAGECGQWRIPFERILAQIPKEKVEAIRAADGAVDVVWKTGDLESQPLPLILLPPTQGELDAAFLAEHADVPRIDEKTDLSLDFRLAGIETTPVLLGWLKNNEKHTVLWDDQSRKSSILRVSPRFGMSLDFTRTNYEWRPNIIEPSESIALSISVRKCAEEQRGRRPEIAKVGFVMAGRWEFFNKTVNTIWMAIPGNNSQLRDIHADASWYSIQGQQREGRQDGIAPLLAYVYNPATPPELTCVLWNRTEAEVQVTGSRIIATNAALGYRRELVLPAGLKFPVDVAPGTHTDWRVPWSEVIKQIPPDDLTRIKATDGKLDLVWQANEHISPPLPLLLGWQGTPE